jgi:aryl-alcohol dehydrogenase-like predicted oxidoreductase
MRIDYSQLINQGKVCAMKYRTLGKTGFEVSDISFGAWAIGGGWGIVDDADSMRALEAALECGVNFFDTADVYGDGRSERLIARLAKEKKQRIIVTTKAGRRLDPHTTQGYNLKNITAFVERSLKNLETDCVDLLQLHCPPSEVYENEAFFSDLDTLVRDGKIRYLGVSVEKVSEAQRAIEYENVCTVQIIFNMFRLKPADTFFEEARRRNVGILARVPLASGLLTGKMTAGTQFAADDHRQFNRYGQAFDRGETFSGVDYAKGIEAAEELKRILPPGMTMAQFALRWILMHDAVSCAIPGGKTQAQIEQNAAASDLPALTPETMDKVRAIYDRYVRADVHPLW